MVSSKNSRHEKNHNTDNGKNQKNKHPIHPLSFFNGRLQSSSPPLPLKIRCKEDASFFQKSYKANGKNDQYLPSMGDYQKIVEKATEKI